MKELVKKNEQHKSKKIITDCQSVTGELLSTFHFTHQIFMQDETYLHLYHEKTLEEHATKIALLLQHKIKIFVKKEILDPFQKFLSGLQEKYPMLFCRELVVTIIE